VCGQTFIWNVHRITLVSLHRKPRAGYQSWGDQPDTFRSPTSWPVAIYSRDMLAVCYTGCWPLFLAGPAAAILSYSCMYVCCVAGRQSPCRDEECVAVCCCADVPSCLLYKPLHSWRSVLLSFSCVVLTCVYFG